MVVREDLPPAVQAVQAVHAALEYVKDQIFPPPPDTLALLAARDEHDLIWLCADAYRAGIPYAEFREPDLGNQVTAVALGPEAARLCRKFPLLLRREGVNK